MAMKAMGRRDFMLGAFLRSGKGPNDSRSSGDVEAGRADDRVQIDIGNGLAKKSTIAKVNAIIAIGKIANFPIGENKIFEQHGIVVESFPEGLRVCSTLDSGQYFAVTSNPFGALQVHIAEKWPAHRVYSIMTNEPTFLSAADLNESEFNLSWKEKL